MKKREVEDMKAEGTKRNEDAMDVDQTTTHLPLKEATKHPNEHSPNQLTPTQNAGAEDASRMP